MDEINLVNIAHQLAAYLNELNPAGWVADVEDYSVLGRLTAGDGRQIRLRDDHHGRLVISGLWPTDAQHSQVIHDDDDPPRITVSATRAPDAIAGDIQRRFMPGFDRCWQIAGQRVAERQYRLNEQRRIVKLLATAFNAEPRDDSKIRLGSYPNQPSGRIDVYHSSDGKTTIHAQLNHLTIDQALAIAQALNQNQTNPETKP